MLKEFEKDKLYRMKTWDELIQMPEVKCKGVEEEEYNKALDTDEGSSYYIKEMDFIKNRIVKGNDSCGWNYQGESEDDVYLIEPWMCEEVEEWKDITRKEFMEMLEDTQYGFLGQYSCPEDLGLHEYDGCPEDCKKCWLKAIENIQFKGEDNVKEVFEKGKKYKILKWNELCNKKGVTNDLADGIDPAIKCNGEYSYRMKMDKIKDRVITISKNCKNVIIDDRDTNSQWIIEPWMCEELGNKTGESLEEKMKAKGFELSGGESYDELIKYKECLEVKPQGNYKIDDPESTVDFSNLQLDNQIIQKNKSKQHDKICKLLNEIYIKKNHDYGDSFGETFKTLGLVSAITRITDKVNRLQSLCTKEQLVQDESIKDTLMDAANYCIMTLIELENNKEDK